MPYRGSLWLLFGLSSLFLASTLGMGLLISTLTRNQFNAAMVALNAAFLPAVMLSGFIFEIHSMPVPVQAVSYLILPAISSARCKPCFWLGISTACC